jgi:hypothetical protein
VGVWLTPIAESNALLDGGTSQGAPCTYTGFVASADFSRIVVKPGKSKTVTIPDVPVPAVAGWWQVSALPDINCTLPGSAVVYTQQPNPYAKATFAAFEVVA